MIPPAPADAGPLQPSRSKRESPACSPGRGELPHAGQKAVVLGGRPDTAGRAMVAGVIYSYRIPTPIPTRLHRVWVDSDMSC